MGKLVVLRFGTGSLTTGFSIILQIGEENARPTSEVAGALPPDPGLLTQFQQWQTLYRSLDFAGRPMGIAKAPFPASAAVCRQAGQELGDRLNHWLQSALFRPIREKWLEKLQPQDVIRIIIQTEDLQLPKLPWHLWEMFDRYSKAEMGLAESGYEQVNPPVPVLQVENDRESTPVKVLALLGDSTGIQLQADRQLLEQLPHAVVTFLVEPALQDLSDRLWEQHWDILFFAGHSSSQTQSSSQAQSGRIFINATESLTMAQLRYALRKAVDGGMKLAIFNSCDGLGMAHELADLQIPQVIVMREPVPDRVAQEFLKYFLQSYAQGETLYLSVRQARERLQGLENQFPCASWLPVIFQNLAELPPTWQGLAGLGGAVSKQAHRHVLQKIGRILATTVMTTAVVMGVRSLGILQPLELQAYDQLLQLRPTERPDNRLLVVTITEEDVQAQAQEQRQGSLSDTSLDKLLEKLEAAQPLAIGLDIYRDYSVQNLPQLADRLRHDRLIGICRVSDPQANRAGISPPPEIPGDRLGFSDLMPDADNVIRRHLLALTPPPDSSCTAAYAFSVQLALRYLSTRNIALKITPDGIWLLGKLRLQPLESHSGGYQGIDAWGHQILLNYRKVPTSIAPTITLSQVLNNQFDANAVKDKIVLIGTTAESFQDYSLTPFQNQQGQIQPGRVQKIPGVMLQAQQTSQILSAALEGRSLIWTATLEQETLWVLLWSMAGGLLAGWVKRSRVLGLSSAVAIALLYGFCWLVFAQWAGWIPLIPAAIAFLASVITVRLLKIHNL